MYLFKRGSRYYISYINEDGKEIRVSTGRKTKGEATASLLEFTASQHRQKLRREEKLLSDFIKEFERHSQCQHSPKTTSSYRTAMEEFQRAMGDRQLKEYGIRDVEDFILKKRGDLSLHSVRSYHTHLSAAFEVARRWGYIVGLDAKVHFHSLRHSFASWLVQGGVSLYEVQKLLGHGSLLVTQIYAHLQPETLHGTVNKIRLNLN